MKSLKYLKTFENFELGNNQEEDQMNREEKFRQDREAFSQEEEDEYPNEFDEFSQEEEEFDEFSDEECGPCEDEMPGEEITLEKKKAKGLPPWLKKKGKKDEKGESKKDDKKSEPKSGGKGLSAKQKRLPEGLRKAIEAKKK